jgi:RNA-dependent RNA polymerase
MLIKRTRHNTPRGKVKMVLNLGRKEIDIRFPSVYSGKTREYKFIIPIDQVFDLSQFQSQNDTKTSFILTLRTPPHFYKKLSAGIKSTHDDAAFTWREKDAWLRQTNVLSHEEEVSQLNSRPITLKNYPEGVVNIGRWTTYRITINDETIDKEKYRVFRAALRDHNVSIAKIQNFEIVYEVDPAWDLLDLSLSEYASVPAAAPAIFEHSLQGLFDSKNEMYLPFPVRYQLDVCISNGWINEHNVTRTFLEVLSKTEQDRAKHILETVALGRSRVFDPMDVFKLRVPRLPSMKRIPDNCVLIRSAIITPSTMVVNTPCVEMTNRVIRRYREHADRFLRVRFEDDELRGFARINATSQKTVDEVLSKVFRTLTNGIVIGDRHYEFLAFGNSQLREHGAYFFAPLPAGPTSSHIRAWMGRFEHERIVAKHAARIGQCFSTTRAIRNAGFPPVRRMNLIDDIERNRFNFTDGVGMISRFYAETIGKELGIRGPPPSLYQFRMAGCKGVLAIAPELGATNVKIRRSQFKFETTYSGMEIIRWSEYWAATLNRQLILVLSALGVPDDVFLLMQEKEIQLMERAMTHDSAALEALTGHVDPNRMTLTIAELVQTGFRRSNEPFVTSLLWLWRAWSIKYLKEKARLSVRDGAFILGCTDETGTLRGHYDSDQGDDTEDPEAKMAKLPEVFVQITCPDSGHRRIIEGFCVIARNPSLHPGDVRVVKAVDVPALHHLVDVLVMPQTGDRDLSSMCSGGDLDGDDYVVIWDERLLPEIWNAEPMDYTPLPPKPLDRDVTQTDITKFFVNYMKNDFLPTIALSHLAWADFLDEGIRHEKCLHLAQLHSKAVDYPKSGQPAKMSKELNAKRWPHFMEKKGRNSYQSHKILGQLYDAVDRVAFVPNYDAPFDERILNACEPANAIMQQARELKHDYDTSLQRVMAQHDIKTEFEVWSTFVINHSKASKDYKFHEEIGQLSNSLKVQYYAAVVDSAGGKDWSHLVPWAVAMYRVTKEELEAAKLLKDGSVMPFISFPWLLRSTLTQIVKCVDQSTTKQPNQNSEDLPGSIQQPAFNSQTQIYDDPYQPGTNAVEDKISFDTQKPDVLTSDEHTGPNGRLTASPDYRVDNAATAHADVHRTSNGVSASESSAADSRFPPQPTSEQYALIEKIINAPESSKASSKINASYSRVPEKQIVRMSAIEELADDVDRHRHVDVAESMIQPGFSLPASVGVPQKDSSRHSKGLVGDSPAGQELSDMFTEHRLVNPSGRTSSTGSGILIDVDAINTPRNDDHPTKLSMSSTLSEELAGLKLEPASSLAADPDALEIRLPVEANGRHSSACVAENKDGRSLISLMDGATLQSDGTAENRKGLALRNPSLLPGDSLRTANVSGRGDGDGDAQMRCHNRMDEIEDTHDDDNDDDDDDEMVFVDPLTAGGGENDADRLLRLSNL